jgi:hypothetical protein
MVFNFDILQMCFRKVAFNVYANPLANFSALVGSHLKILTDI